MRPNWRHVRSGQKACRREVVTDAHERKNDGRGWPRCVLRPAFLSGRRLLRRCSPGQQHTGLGFISSQTHSLPIIDVQISFLAGSAFDPADQPGLAAMTAAMLDQGAGERDEKAVAETLADIGAQLGSGAGMDSASMSLRTLSDPERRATAVSLMADALARPHFDAAVFKRDQARSVAALKESLTKPQVLAQRAYMSAIYPEHPYGRLTTPESLARIERNDLERFWRRHYSAARASVALVGDLTRAEAEALVVQITEALPADQVDVPKTLPPPQATRANTVRVDHPASQAHLMVGMPAVARDDPEQIALQVGNYTLGGGGFVSLLTKAVREDRGYAYSVVQLLPPQAGGRPIYDWSGNQTSTGE